VSIVFDFRRLETETAAVKMQMLTQAVNSNSSDDVFTLSVLLLVLVTYNIFM